MNCLHIFVTISQDLHAQFALFDEQGTKVYEGHCKVQPSERAKAISQYRKLDPLVHEQIVRVITREYASIDIGLGTPIFAI